MQCSKLPGKMSNGRGASPETMIIIKLLDKQTWQGPPQTCKMKNSC